MHGQRRVEAAAIRLEGRVYTLPRPARHGDVLLWMESERRSSRGSAGFPAPLGGHQMGFVDQDGVFMSRLEAFAVALAAGQLEPGRALRDLATEDLW